METGPGNVKIPPGCALVIRCSKKFTALGLSPDGHLASILGPSAETDRTLRRIIPLDVNTLKMQTSKLAHWEYSYSDRHGAEELDLTPIEIPVDTGPLRYEDEMRRIVRDELSRNAEAQHQETFEEADDFEILDAEDETESSEYEITEMQDEAELFNRADGVPPPVEPVQGKRGQNNADAPKPDGATSDGAASEVHGSENRGSTEIEKQPPVAKNVKTPAPA